MSETVSLTAGAYPPHVPAAGRRADGVSGTTSVRQPTRAYGAAWDGRRSWLDRPPQAPGPGLFLAGPFSAAGSGISAEILSAALASYADPGLIPAWPPPGNFRPRPVGFRRLRCSFALGEDLTT